MIALLLWACGGHGDETPDQPIPGEAVIADSVKWRLHDGGVVRFLEHRGEPALAVSVPNHTAGSAYYPDTTPLSDAPIVMILAPPFVGGSLLEVADASVSDDQQVIAMDAADWTGDGVDDLAVHLRLFAGPFFGDGVPEPVATWFWTTEEVACDLDSDGVLDLCTDAGPILGPLSGEYTQGDTAFSIAVEFGERELDHAETVHAGDVTGDGLQDLIFSDRNTTRSRLEVYLLTDPLSSPHWDLDSDVDVTWYNAGTMEQEQLDVTSDLDGDGTRDLLTSPAGTVLLVTEKTSGKLADAASRIEGFGSAVSSGDVDGNGHTDVVASSVGPMVGQVAIWLGPFTPGTYGRRDAAAIWKATEHEEDAFGEQVLVTDLDRDGQDDLVVTAPSADPDGMLHLLWGGNL